mgnify:CR=1 FL=1
MHVTITQASYNTLCAHAAETYPNECCGIIVHREGREEVVRVTNVQDALHAQDPGQYPRTATTAYTMGPEAAPILLDAERGLLTVYAFYHSHPEHDAYFSEEDRFQAKGGWDEPLYPDAGQIVVSVRQGVVVAAKSFRWCADTEDFVDAELVRE